MLRIVQFSLVAALQNGEHASQGSREDLVIRRLKLPVIGLHRIRASSRGRRSGCFGRVVTVSVFTILIFATASLHREGTAHVAQTAGTEGVANIGSSSETVATSTDEPSLKTKNIAKDGQSKETESIGFH
jgi:hypothetical protein